MAAAAAAAESSRRIVSISVYEREYTRTRRSSQIYVAVDALI